METNLILQEKQIVSKIYLIRGQRVMLDVDLAEIYGVSKKRVREQIRRNLDRFPPDFMFELDRKEFYNLESYSIYDQNRNIIDLQNANNHDDLRLTTHFASSNAQIIDNQIYDFRNKDGRGGSLALPIAFSEHGILMLSNVLNSPQAMKASVDIIRVFVKMRDFLLSNQEILTKISELGHKVGEHDQYIQTLYEYLKSFDEEQKRRIEWENRKPIGFVVRQE